MARVHNLDRKECEKLFHDLGKGKRDYISEEEFVDMLRTFVSGEVEGAYSQTSREQKKKLAQQEREGGGEPLYFQENAVSVAAQLLLKKADLVKIGEDTKFGINANKGVRREAESIIESLVNSKERDYSLTSCVGKWTLIYTDAPDITSLDRLPTSQLGRVGQEVLSISGPSGDYEVR
ncbi:hypothetical protein TrRE_jg6868, partial [Triparma retinervis]